MMHNYIKVETN